MESPRIWEGEKSYPCAGAGLPVDLSVFLIWNVSRWVKAKR